MAVKQTKQIKQDKATLTINVRNVDCALWVKARQQAIAQGLTIKQYLEALIRRAS